MNRYFIRAGKYCLYLVVLILLLLLLMNVMSPRANFAEVYLTTRGLLMLGIIVVFSLAYPMFGFIKKTITFDASKKVDEVEKVMSMCGYVRIGGSDDAMVFRVSGTTKKLLLMWEDTITITTIDGLSTMSGPRKEVVKANFRFGTFIS